MAVDEPESGLLVALAADGRLITSRGGRTWTEQGRLPAGGEPAVLTAATARHLLAADGTDTVYESTDGGRTRTALHRPDSQAERP